MKSDDEDQTLVAALLASVPPPDVPADFVSRVNARIDETAGWFGLADFRLWTLRLAPMAAGLALIAVLWQPAATTVTTGEGTAPSANFSPASASDWQQDVSADALLDAALQPSSGGTRVR
jgi:hypothetical protein